MMMEDSWCAVLCWTGVLSLMATHVNLLTMDLTILSFVCGVFQNFSVIKYVSLDGQTLR